MKHEIHQFQKLNPGLKQAEFIGIFSKQFKFEKYEQIKTKQSMLFIYEAWHKVSDCWRHSGILNQLKTTETTEKTVEEIKIHLSKYKAGFEPIYTADEFIHIDDFEDTCKELTELDLINRYTKPYIEEGCSYD